MVEVNAAFKKQRLKNIVVLEVGSGTYTVPDGVTAILVEGWGGGGGSGGVATAAVSAGGSFGGGGAEFAQLFREVAAADEFPYVVGAGGSAGASGNNNGGNGADSTFGSPVILRAKGGSGGAGNSSGTTAFCSGSGGLGGSGGVGDLTIPGAEGQGPIRISGTNALSGHGGAAARGAGLNFGRNSAGAGIVGKVPGGGAAGANVSNGSSSVAGAAGGAGRIVIYEFGP